MLKKYNFKFSKAAIRIYYHNCDYIGQISLYKENKYCDLSILLKHNKFTHLYEIKLK